MSSTSHPLARRTFLRSGGAILATAALTGTPSLFAQDLAWLDVASAGSARNMLEGPLKTAAAQTLHLNLRTHAQGADTVARSLVDGTLLADLFIPITASPMGIVMRSGKIQTAWPIAATELVLLYSPKSRFLAQFQAAAQGHANWWEILQQSGIRIARSNPANDPSGRAIFFMMMLAARKYGQPDLVEKVLGSPLNPAQVLSGGNTQARLQSGEIDAMCVYKTGPANTGQPYISLPAEINLSRLHVRDEHPDLRLVVEDKTFYPEPLIFYAGILNNAPNPKGAAAFLAWLQQEQAQALFLSNHFAAPGTSTPIRA
ncbi:extracellular solute-binding protein [Granulicella sp. 5B5]|uniref:extracellular solute-binding protein n=1 Tax=Granulicella sp. 5B5 TaxID=1617967 RepID=UPI0015F38053|nr:extracellular solute-binding protein [Granulicella sp. 5B5]QMV19053.1 extracellular solute-binding protein [Granulicella sp. 5B5]